MMAARVTRKEIRRLVRMQIISAIKNDLPGGLAGEDLMKEVWEQLDGDGEFRTAHNEMREIIQLLQERNNVDNND
jgi:hypothetical protein